MYPRPISLRHIPRSTVAYQPDVVMQKRGVTNDMRSHGCTPGRRLRLRLMSVALIAALAAASTWVLNAEPLRTDKTNQFDLRGHYAPLSTIDLKYVLSEPADDDLRDIARQLRTGADPNHVYRYTWVSPTFTHKEDHQFAALPIVMTYLHRGAYDSRETRRRMELAELLLAHGANTGTLLTLALTSTQYAWKRDTAREGAALLLEYGADVTAALGPVIAREGREGVGSSSDSGLFGTRFLLDRGANLGTPDAQAAVVDIVSRRLTATDLIRGKRAPVRNADVKMLRFLLSRGLDVKFAKLFRPFTASLVSAFDP